MSAKKCRKGLMTLEWHFKLRKKIKKSFLKIERVRMFYNRAIV